MARARTEDTDRRARELLKQPYTRVLVPEEEGGFSAEILELPGCFASGETVSETHRNLEAAALSWIEAELAKGASIPQPIKHYDASGTFLLRPPRTLQARATLLAAMDGVSLNQLWIAAMAEYIGQRTALARSVKMPTTAQVVIVIRGGMPTLPETSGTFSLSQDRVPIESATTRGVSAFQSAEYATS